MRGLFAFVAGGAMLLSSAVSGADVSRAPAALDEQEQIAGNPWVPWIVALIAAIAIVLVITDDEDEPQSP